MKRLTPFLLLLALPLAGCSLTNKIAEKAVEKGLETATGAKDIDFSEDGATIKTDNGEVSTGSNAKLPSSWPSSVPTPKDASLTYSTSSKSNGNESWAVTYQTSKDAMTASDAYKNTLTSAGWTISSDSNYNSDGKTYASFTAEKGDLKVTCLALDGDDGKAALTVSVEKVSS